MTVAEPMKHLRPAEILTERRLRAEREAAERKAEIYQ